MGALRRHFRHRLFPAGQFCKQYLHHSWWNALQLHSRPNRQEMYREFKQKEQEAKRQTGANQKQSESVHQCSDREPGIRQSDQRDSGYEKGKFRLHV